MGGVSEMSESDAPKDWKLKLRYGHIQTPYQHFTTISDGVFTDGSNEFDCPAGPAFMTMRMWASDTEEAARMASIIGEDIGFSVTGRVHIYDTPPEEPPRDNPHGYDISFTPYEPEH